MSQGIDRYKVPVVLKIGKLNEMIEVSALWSIYGSFVYHILILPFFWFQFTELVFMSRQTSYKNRSLCFDILPMSRIEKLIRGV